MRFTEENCEIHQEKGNFIFKGRMELADYGKVAAFLEKAEQEIREERIIYNIKDLQFLNSSGIRALAIHFLRSPKKYTIYIENSLTWQRVGIIPLGKMKNPGDILIEW